MHTQNYKGMQWSYSVFDFRYQTLISFQSRGRPVSLLNGAWECLIFFFKDITTDTIPISQPVNMTLKGTTSAYCVSFNLIYLIISTIILSEYIRYTCITYIKQYRQ